MCAFLDMETCRVDLSLKKFQGWLPISLSIAVLLTCAGLVVVDAGFDFSVRGAPLGFLIRYESGFRPTTEIHFKYLILNLVFFMSLASLFVLVYRSPASSYLRKLILALSAGLLITGTTVAFPKVSDALGGVRGIRIGRGFPASFVFVQRVYNTEGRESSSAIFVRPGAMAFDVLVWSTSFFLLRYAWRFQASSVVRMTTR